MEGPYSSMEPQATISVRVTPRAARDELAGWREGVLVARVTAPPVEGKANAALVRLLASALGIAPSRVSITGGRPARTKRVQIEGLSPDEVRVKLGG
jgi:uncharacterized protein (TIGR00251 family)